MPEKLRADQRKLWRRIYLETYSKTADDTLSANAADTAVARWEARGAFDEDDPRDQVQKLIEECRPILCISLSACNGGSAVMRGDEFVHRATAQRFLAIETATVSGDATIMVVSADARSLPDCPQSGEILWAREPRRGIDVRAKLTPFSVDTPKHATANTAPSPTQIKIKVDATRYFDEAGAAAPSQSAQ